MTLSSVDLPAPLGPMTLDDLAAARRVEVHALEDLVGGAVAGDDALDAQEAHRRRPM